MATALRLSVLALACVPALASCGDDLTGAGTAIARIEIRPGGELLTADRPSATLTAVAFDAEGNEVQSAFTWSSSAPEQIAVDGSGTVSAEGDLGSASVHAEAGGVRSAPAIIAMVELHPGSVLVTDDQVVSVGEPFLPDGAAPEDYPLMDVRLQGIDPPAAGTIVVAGETATLGGEVVSAEQDGAEVAVRLQMVSMPELYARYDIDLNLLLADYDVVDDEVPASELEAAVLPVEEKLLDKKWPSEGPFQCSASITGFLEKNFVSLKLSGDGTVIFKTSRLDASLPPGYLKVAIEGPITLKGSLGLKANAGFKGKAKCELKGHIPILLGPFSIVIAPAIPLGVGVSLDAKLTAASMELGLEGENGFDFALGFECPGTAPCHSLDKAAPINKFKPVLDVPRGPKDMRVEMSAQAYFLTGVDLVFAGRWTFEAIEATVGPVQSAKLASVDTQADDRAYASNYDLKLEGKVGLGSGVDKAIKKLLGDDQENGTLGLELSVSKPLSKSPVGKMTVDKATTSPHKKVTFTVDLEADSLEYFLLGWNVKSILFYRKKVDEPTYELMKELEVSTSGTRYSWDWTPMNDDLGKWEFFAFVKTKMPVIELEIAPDSSKQVEVIGICSGAPAVGPRGTGSGCELVGTVSHTMNSTYPGGSTTETADATVTLQEDDASSTGGLIAFRPYGTFSGSHSGTLSTCTLTVSPDPMTGTLNGDPSQGVLFVHYGDPAAEDYLYEGNLESGLVPVTQTIACPDAEPIVQETSLDLGLFLVFADQNLFIDPATNKATGTYTTSSDDGMGNSQTDTWTWDLTLQTNDIPPPPVR